MLSVALRDVSIFDKKTLQFLHSGAKLLNLLLKFVVGNIDGEPYRRVGEGFPSPGFEIRQCPFGHGQAAVGPFPPLPLKRGEEAVVDVHRLEVLG